MFCIYSFISLIVRIELLTINNRWINCSVDPWTLLCYLRKLWKDVYKEKINLPTRKFTSWLDEENSPVCADQHFYGLCNLHKHQLFCIKMGQLSQISIAWHSDYTTIITKTRPSAHTVDSKDVRKKMKSDIKNNEYI